MKISKELYAELRRLTRAAQRRMERATPGQRKALEYYVKKATGETKWSSAAKNMSTQQANARIQQLRKFMGYNELNKPIKDEEGRPVDIASTRKGWEAIKRANVEAAQATLERRRKGFNINQSELKMIFEQVTKDFQISDEELAERKISREEALHQEKYRVINLITASKVNRQGFMVNEASIAEAMADTASAQAAYKYALDARKKLVARSNEGADIPF
jgi:hypothetical protein